MSLQVFENKADVSIAYDEQGNILNDGMGTTYSWDAENRLVTVESANSKVENGYDYRNFRVWKKSYSGSVVYTDDFAGSF